MPLIGIFIVVDFFDLIKRRGQQRSLTTFWLLLVYYVFVCTCQKSIKKIQQMIVRKRLHLY